MEEIRISTLIDGVQIPAVLVTPSNPMAALLLIPGSANSDVDGNYAPMFPGQPGIAPHAYKDLAEQLCSAGIAVFRYAKGGPGTGTVVVNKEESAEKFRVFSQRVRVAEVFLAELERLAPGVPCVVAGHSEGAVVATLLAPKYPEIRGLVSLSGPAQPLLRMMMTRQFDTEKSAGTVTAEKELLYRAALALLDDFVAARELPPDYTSNPYAGTLSFSVRPENASYLRSLEAIDPAAEFAKVPQPALIIQGGRDESVPPVSAQILHQARPEATVELFPELQHFYKKVPDGLSAQESFGQESESDPTVAMTISSWITDLVKRP